LEVITVEKILIEFEPEGMSDEERAESTEAIVTLLHLVLPYMVSNVTISDPDEEALHG
jgi:hypothetical protein